MFSQIFMWDGLTCRYGGHDPVRIISLNLSSSGLTGEISSYISDLNMIQFLDLRGNNLAGSVSVELIERSNSGSLLLSVAGNSDLCSSLSWLKKKHKYIVPVIASAASLIVLLIAIIIGWRLIKRTKRAEKADKPKFMRKIGSALEPKNHQFTYSEIMIITNNFEKVIRKGGFGTVYHGYLNDTQVAIKMLSDTSSGVQGVSSGGKNFNESSP